MIVPVTYLDSDGRGRAWPFWKHVLDHFYHEIENLPDHNRYPPDSWGELAIFEELKKYKAHLKKNKETHIIYLEFEDEEDATLFLLRWA